MKKRLTKAEIRKLEDKIDIREGLAALKNKKGTITLEEYMKRKGEGGGMSPTT